jgi:hypothetical protein
MGINDTIATAPATHHQPEIRRLLSEICCSI